jgi:hypothetical protein
MSDSQVFAFVVMPALVVIGGWAYSWWVIRYLK